MSNTYGSENQPGEDLNLGDPGWTPTPPASEFIGLSQPAPPAPGQPSQSGGPGYGQSNYQPYGAGTPDYGQPGYGSGGAVPPQQYPQYGQQAPLPPIGQTPPPPYQQADGYNVYSQPSSPAMPAYPAPVYSPGVLVPGQVVQTPYGLFTVGPKSKMAAGLLGIFLGSLGVGRFYRGFVGVGVAQLLVTIFTAGFGWIWGLIDGILVLAAQPGTPASLDSDGQLMA